MKTRLLTGTLLAMSAASVSAADWPQFRGPQGNGISTEMKLPTEWTSDQHIAWKAPVAGVAWSCPIVVGDKVFVTTAVADGQPKPRGGFGGPPGGGGGPPGGGGRPGGGGGGGRGGAGGPDKVYQWKIVCLDLASGKEAWASLVSEGKPKYGTHGSNTFASETPVSDGKHIYAYFASAGTVVAYDLAGKQVWKKDIGAFPMQMNWGSASSPVLHDGLLFIQCDNEEKSFVLALDTKTGVQKWKVDRPEKSGWSTPFVWTTPTRTDLVVGGSQKVRGYEPATGKLVWELSTGGGQCSPSPTGDSERLYFGTGMAGGGGGRPGGPPGGPPGGGGGRPGGGMGMGGGGTLYAIKAGATGDISLKDGKTSNDGVAWSLPKATPAAASPIVYDGLLYTFERQGGLVSCYDAKTGATKYAKERLPNAKAFWASPWAYDGKIFALDEDGNTFVLKAGATFELLHKNTLAKDIYWASPAVSNGRVFVRGVDAMICIK